MEITLNTGLFAKNSTNIGLDLEVVTSLGCDYNLLFSGKGVGKSYAVRERMLKKCVDYKDEFIILRRLKEDCKESMILDYFAKVNVEKLTAGKYNAITMYHSKIFFSNIDGDTMKVTRGQRIGHVIPVSKWERYKGTDYPLVSTIVFEEFISESNSYCVDEPNTLIKLISTIYRPHTPEEFETLTKKEQERIGRHEVFLVGNTISRLSPYFREWDLSHVLKQKQDTIDIYTFHIDDETGQYRDVRLACWYISNASKQHSFVFGKKADSIVKGSWEVDIVPHLPEGDYRKLYEFLVVRQSTYCVQLLRFTESRELVLYCYPSTKNRKVRRIISEDFSTSFYITRTLMSNTDEKLISWLLANNKICYSDNLTGTEFKKYIPEII